MKTIKNYIGGELVEPVSKKYLDNINPATAEVYSIVPDSEAADVEKAIAAAKSAFPAWSALPTKKRSSYLRKIASKIKEKAAELAKAETIDNGKPIKLSSTVDIPRSSTNFEFYANAITQWSHESHPMDGHAINYTLREPLGVVSCISPWNLPLYLFSWKIAPALAVGNTVVAKPSEVTPMTAFLLSEICIEVGLPPGVLNIIHGRGPQVGTTMTTHPDVKAISFTGSTATGRLIAQTAAPLFKKYSLEMGGKNPNIIFEDCDFEQALKTTVHSSFANQGQICLCGSRIYVQKPIYEKFKNALIEKANSRAIGNPMDPDTQHGALVSKEHFEKVMHHISIAKDEGGSILCGGQAVELPEPNNKGYFVAPTLIEGLDNKCRTNQEEIFGPVATITPFDSENEVIALANDSEYGLSSTLWTQDVARANRVASKIKTGIVWVNTWLLRDLRTPFGGMKSSGVGREGGNYALNFFSEPKNVCIKI